MKVSRRRLIQITFTLYLATLVIAWYLGFTMS